MKNGILLTELPSELINIVQAEKGAEKKTLEYLVEVAPQKSMPE